MAAENKSKVCVRHMIPLESRIVLFRSLVLTHFSFSSAFKKNLTLSQMNILIRQINTELIINQHILTRVFDVTQNFKTKKMEW